MTTQYSINTLHRGKFMLCFFVLLFVAGGLSSLIPAKEIVKIIVVLFTIPVILYLSVRISKRPSLWSINEQMLTIDFTDKIISYPTEEIDRIQTLTRSGGTLYVIYFKKKSPARYWRNKLFQNEDDQLALQQFLTTSTIEYYKF